MKELEVKQAESKEVEALAQSTEKVTEKMIEDSLNFDNLTDVEDSTQILQFGAKAQNKISEFSDSVLEGVKTKQTGEVGDLLADLVAQIKDFDSDIQIENRSIIGKLFYSAKKEVTKIVAKYNKIDVNIDKIEKELDRHRLQMLKDITIFDTMYEKNLQYFKEISLYIIAGEKKLEELRNVVLPELQKKAEETKEQLDVQRVNDMVNTINRFEKKIYDLKTTRVISIQMAPQIRMLQSNETELVEKIQSSLINENGKVKRAEAEKELVEIERELKEKLVEIKVEPKN